MKILANREMNMKIKLTVTLSIILASMLLMQGSYGVESAEKYLNFELKPVYGINPYDADVKNISVPSDLKETYANYFEADKDFSKGIIAYLEYLPGEYGVVGGARIAKIKNLSTGLRHVISRVIGRITYYLHVVYWLA